MGSLTLRSFSLQPKINMKAFIVLFALVAAAYADAEAEADPYLLYGGYNGYAGWGGWTGYHGLPYGAYGYAGSVYGVPHGAYGLTSAVKTVAVEPAKVEVATKLVSAPVVAAPVVAAAPAAYTYHHAYAGAPVAYSGYGYPYAAHLAAAPVAAAHVIAKRDAEADADPAYFYNGYGGYGYAGWGGYGYPYAGVYGAYPYAHAYHGLAAAPSDPTNPHLVHTSRFGICTNYLGAQVSC